MLVKFSFRNFKTFREEAELTLVANTDTTRQSDNVIKDLLFSFNILKSAVVYGANASGKSKMMEGLSFMKQFAINSSIQSQKGQPVDVEPFLLDTVSSASPSMFEIIFIHKSQLFRYGFEVNRQEITSEWLYHRPKTKEVEIFYREGQEFEIHQRQFAKGATLIKEKLIRNNALMLSVAAQFNDKLAGDVIDWFNRLRIISGIRESDYADVTVRMSYEPGYKQEILELMQAADLGIEDISFKSSEAGIFPPDDTGHFRKIVPKPGDNPAIEAFQKPVTAHNIYDEDLRKQGTVSFSMEKHESHGTQKFFYLTGPILDAIKNGMVLVVDELDSNIHPRLVYKIVELFNSGKINRHNAQLIFNTHNTTLLDSDLFRRDQIWFAEKDQYGAAKLFSLADFKSDVRKTENFERNYLLGKYGAVPIVEDFGQQYMATTAEQRADEQ
jgi:uncharacterized protein